MKATITQQALNVLRQIVSAQGWATSIDHIYMGGKLLAETLPKLDPLDWVLAEADIKVLSDKEKTAYLKKDVAWGTKPIAITITDDEQKIIQTAFQHFATTSAAAKQLGPNPFLFELIKSFDIKDSDKK